MSEKDNDPKANPTTLKPGQLGAHYYQMLQAYGISDKAKPSVTPTPPAEVAPIRKVEKPASPEKLQGVATVLAPSVRHSWEFIQQKYSYPVNAIGIRIDPKDRETLKVWRENGLDKFLKSEG